MQTNEPAHALVAVDAPSPASRRRGFLPAVAGLAAASVAVALLATGGPVGSPDRVSGAVDRAGAPTSGAVPTADLADIQLIAARSGEALARSGRAVVKFASDTDGGQFLSSTGTADIAFSGDDIEMTIRFDGSDETSPERGAFTAQNKTVDGEFYLLDGPVGDKRWVHDTNAAGGRGSEIFNVDPRTLFPVLSAGAGFELVGREDVDGVAASHYRSTRPVPASSMNFGLGPVGEATVTADVIDLWVGPDDIATRVDLQLSYPVEAVDPASAPLIGKNPDGSMTVTGTDGSVTVIPVGEPFPDLPMTTRTVRSTYSVTFSDVGAPITIDPPAEFTDVAGVG